VPPTTRLGKLRHRHAFFLFAAVRGVALALGLALVIGQWRSCQRDLQQPANHNLVRLSRTNGSTVPSSATAIRWLAPLPKMIHVTLQLSKRSDMSKENRTAADAAEGVFSLEDLSSVDYVACCGLGHRLTKMSDAFLVSKRLRLAFRAFWGYCAGDDRGTATDAPTEVFHYLFGPQPADELQHLVPEGAVAASHRQNVTYDHYLRLSNQVKNFAYLRRFGPDLNRPCQCTQERVDSDVEFYTNLRRRFRFRSAIDEFRTQHFGLLNNAATDGPPVLGLHIRAGNGEQGDFAARGRAVADLDSWLQSVATLLQRRQEWNASTIFVATDTPRVVPSLQALLHASTNMNVISLEQSRPEEGKGVLFGEQSRVDKSGGDRCRKGWVDVMSDMILLSHTDVMIAARPSSFTQSMPLSLVFENSSSQAHAINKEFCEVNRDATEMRCYRSVMDWCCNGTTTFSLDGISQKYDYISVPTTNVSHPDAYKGFQRRTAASSDSLDVNQGMRTDAVKCPPRGLHRRQDCVPYDWSDFYQRSS
jgi:hypothetical protein